MIWGKNYFLSDKNKTALFSTFFEIIDILTEWINKFEDWKKNIEDLFPTFDNLQGKMHII